MAFRHVCWYAGLPMSMAYVRGYPDHWMREPLRVRNHSGWLALTHEYSRAPEVSPLGPGSNDRVEEKHLQTYSFRYGLPAPAARNAGMYWPSQPLNTTWPRRGASVS